MTLQLGLLYGALGAFSAHDVWKRTIPPWLCAVVALGIGSAWTSGEISLSPGAAVMAAVVFWLADLPMGDRAGIFLVALLMTPEQAAVTVLAAGWAGIGYTYGIGRWRSMIGFPFFPAVAICATVVLWCTRG